MRDPHLEKSCKPIAAILDFDIRAWAVRYKQNQMKRDPEGITLGQFWRASNTFEEILQCFKGRELWLIAFDTLTVVDGYYEDRQEFYDSFACNFRGCFWNLIPSSDDTQRDRQECQCRTGVFTSSSSSSSSADD